MASQTQRVVNAFINVLASFSHAVAADSHSSSSPKTVARTMSNNDVGIKQRIKKWIKLSTMIKKERKSTVRTVVEYQSQTYV
jgi:hypothetical protein